MKFVLEILSLSRYDSLSLRSPKSVAGTFFVSKIMFANQKTFYSATHIYVLSAFVALFIIYFI